MKIKRLMCTALLTASTFMFGIAPMTAYAKGEPPKDDEVIVVEEEVVEDTKEEPEITEEFVQYDPLTPDGNLTLVDDFGEPGKVGKQFVTLVTKNGNYFYLIIDRDDKGTETVHFLNLVDERDLLSLMEDEEVEEYLADKAEDEPVTVIPEPTKEPETDADTAPTEEPVDVNQGLDPVKVLPVLIFDVIAIIVAAKLLKSRKDKAKDKPDPDADYVDDSMNDFIEDEILELPEEDEEYPEIDEDGSDEEE
mgnify:CR=1 FL=1